MQISFEFKKIENKTCRHCGAHPQQLEVNKENGSESIRFKCGGALFYDNTDERHWSWDCPSNPAFRDKLISEKRVLKQVEQLLKDESYVSHRSWSNLADVVQNHLCTVNNELEKNQRNQSRKSE